MENDSIPVLLCSGVVCSEKSGLRERSTCAVLAKIDRKSIFFSCRRGAATTGPRKMQSGNSDAWIWRCRSICSIIRVIKLNQCPIRLNLLLSCCLSIFVPTVPPAGDRYWRLGHMWTSLSAHEWPLIFNANNSERFGALPGLSMMQKHQKISKMTENLRFSRSRKNSIFDGQSC